MGQVSVGGIAPENALDALLDELQTFAKPMNNEVGFRKLILWSWYVSFIKE